MRMLVIIPEYFPEEHPRAYRWTHIAEQMAIMGMEVHVLCSRMPGQSENSQRHGVHIHRVGYSRLFQFLRRRKREIAPSPDRPKNEVEGRTGRESRLLLWKDRLNAWFWHSWYWPDGALIWYLPARRKAFFLLSQLSFDAIISVSLPFTAHMVGLACKNKRPEVYWLVDIGDPFSFPPESPKNNTFLYKRWNHQMEATVLNRADSVVVTVESARVAYCRNFPPACEKIRVIPPLFQLPPLPEQGLPNVMDAAKINLAYFGSFYTTIRTPAEFLALLEAFQFYYPSLFDRLTVHFFGTIEPAFQQLFDRFPGLQPAICFHGRVSRSEAFARMKEADILLNISNKTDCQLPSKTVDYRMSGKPVINLCYSERDSSRSFFSGYKSFLNLDVTNQSLEENVARLADFLRGFKRRTADESPLVQEAERYGPPAVARQYLEGLVKKK